MQSDLTTAQPNQTKFQRPVLVLFIILVGHLLLKMLELSEFRLEGYSLTPFFTLQAYADKPWALLLPVNIGGDFYRYSTTGLVSIALLHDLWVMMVGTEMAMNYTYLTLSVLLVTTTYLTAWRATQSRPFTITVTLCMAFGTQFNGLYENASIMTLYLFCTFIEVNLLFFYLLLTSSSPSGRLKAGFIVSLLFVALCWEMWLDYAAFLFVALATLWIINARRKIKLPRTSLRFTLITLSATLIIYMIIKVGSTGGISEHFERGNESESAFNYLREPANHTSVLLIEDVISNLITYNYISFSNYLPGFLISSNALYYFGQQTTTYQYGYHQPAGLFVYYHYVFYWYFFAGAFFLFFLIALYRSGFSIYRDPDKNIALVAFLTLLLILFGSSTHLIIKYRPYLSLPLLGYKCIISIIGVTLLLGLLSIFMHEKLSGRQLNILTVLLWAIIISGAFTRPGRLSNMGVAVIHGKSQGGPDPMKNITAVFYSIFPLKEVEDARKVEKWLNAEGMPVDPSLISIRNNGTVIYKHEEHWTGTVSGKQILWDNSITGIPTVWSPKE